MVAFLAFFAFRLVADQSKLPFVPKSADAFGFTLTADDFCCKSQVQTVISLASSSSHDVVVVGYGGGFGFAIEGGPKPRLMAAFLAGGNGASTETISKTRRLYYPDFYTKLVIYGPVGGAAKTALKKRTGQTEAFAVSPDERFIADVFVSSDRVVRLFDLKTLRQVAQRRVERKDGFVAMMRFSAHANVLGVVDTEGRATLIKVTKAGLGPAKRVAEGVQRIVPIPGTDDFLAATRKSLLRVGRRKKTAKIYNAPDKGTIRCAAVVVRQKVTTYFAVLEESGRETLCRISKGVASKMKIPGKRNRGITHLVATRKSLCIAGQTKPAFRKDRTVYVAFIPISSVMPGK